MRDAFGGTFMIQLLLIFLSIYISFMAVALSYAKAFRVKNQIINYIEQYEGYNDNSIDKIDNYLQKAAYYVDVKTGESSYSSPNNIPIGGTYCGDRGYCITPKNQGNKGTYYVITTYLQIKFPFFDLAFTVPINGETRIVTS